MEKCAVTAEYFAEHAEKFLKDEIPEAGYQKAFDLFTSRLVWYWVSCPGIFPSGRYFGMLLPTLMAGNTTLLKHAPNVCGSAMALEKIFLEAGAPKGVFTSLIIDTPAVEKILASDLVHAVTLTGSEKAGGSVASLAGRL